MGSTLGLSDSSFLLAGLPSYFFVCHHPNILLYLLILCLGWIVCRWGIVVPPTCFSCLFVILRFFRIRAWGIAVCFGGVISSVFSVLIKVGVGMSFMFGGIGHDTLETNKLVDSSKVFGHGVSSLVVGAVDVAMVAVLGCCVIGGLP